MNVTWILVAHRSGARLYEKQDKKLTLVQEIEHPEGKLKNQDINTDRPGRSFDRKGAGRHAMSSEQEATEREAIRFARQLAAILEDGRLHHRYAKLVLVAEPRFLGELRAALTPETDSTIRATLGKDLAWLENQAVPKYLETVTWP